MKKISTMWWAGALIAVFVFILFHFRASIQDLESQNEYLQNSLDKTNKNLDEANANIESAKNSAWGTYGDMGDALDNLDTVQ